MHVAKRVFRVATFNDSQRASMDTETTEQMYGEAPEVTENEGLNSPKENLKLSVRNMSATNAAGGTFGLGLDQFELPKASIAKVARTDVRISIEAYEDP